MEYKQETRVFIDSQTLLLKDDEVDAVLAFIGVSSKSQRMEMGLTKEQAYLLSDIYQGVVKAKSE